VRAGTGVSEQNGTERNSNPRAPADFPGPAVDAARIAHLSARYCVWGRGPDETHSGAHLPPRAHLAEWLTAQKDSILHHDRIILLWIWVLHMAPCTRRGKLDIGQYIGPTGSTPTLLLVEFPTYGHTDYPGPGSNPGGTKRQTSNVCRRT
jgi:hypothetical protein